jgi:hypothetical protein
VVAGARLLKHCVDQASSLSTLPTALHEGWPEKPESLAGARVIVFCGDQFSPVRFKNTAAILKQWSRLADQGCGFVAVHYAIGVNRPAADNAWVQAMLDRLFGSFSNFIPVAEGGTVPRVMQATITPIKGPTSIRARISDDDGAPWGEELVLRTGGGDEDIGYTRQAVRPDGKTVTIYIYYWQENEKAERDIAATLWTPPAGKCAEAKKP